MTIRTIAELKADMPLGVRGGISAQDIHNLIETLESRTAGTLETKIADYTATTADDKKTLIFNSATNVTLTLPANLSAGWECSIIQLGAGQVIVVVLGGELISLSGHSRTSGQNAKASLHCVANAGTQPTVLITGQTAAGPGLLNSVNFNTGSSITTMGLMHAGNTTSVPVDFAGRRCLQVHLHHYDDVVKYRTEFEYAEGTLPSPPFTAGRFPTIGQEYWYSMKTYMPSAHWVADTSTNSIIQWHDVPDSGESTRGSAVSACIRPHDDTGVPRMVIILRGDSKAFTPATGGEYDQTRYDKITTVTDIGAASTFYDKWVTWVWYIKWGYTSAVGKTKLWCNGSVVLDKPAEANCFNDATGPYMKLGIYKWDWQSATATNTDHHTMYFDDIKVGSSSAAYDTMA